MDLLLEGLWNVMEAVGQLFLQPFYYISIILIMLLYRRQVLLERKLFHVRLHSWLSQTWRTVLGGLAAGLSISLVSAFIGMTLTVAVEDRALVFRSDRYFIGLGRRRVRLPAWATPGALTVKHIEETDERFLFSLEIVHPLLGTLTRQVAAFHEAGGSATGVRPLAHEPEVLSKAWRRRV